MAPYRLDILSLTPQSFSSLNQLGVIGRALKGKIAELHLHNPRDFTEDRYRKVDDLPYGGGSGMVLKPEPIFSAFENIPLSHRKRVLLMTPQGKLLHQEDLQRWSKENDQLIIICGHYEGFDERIRTLADEEVSIGDFVLTGGELPAMVVINGVMRLLEGTIGDRNSLLNESHTDSLLEHPHYTRPYKFRDMEVPEVLRSGDHLAIEDWREMQRQTRTKERRPDLYNLWLQETEASGLKIDELIQRSMEIRIGNGYDMHRLTPNRELILGGVKLSHPNGLGLDGHSDADVLAHAITDALLGALSLGDIGKYFPPEDPRWKDSNSLILLNKVVCMIKERGWQIINIDSVVIAERPKLKPHITKMKENLAESMEIDPTIVGVKATTNESLGAEGREEGISSHAVALLQKI